MKEKTKQFFIIIIILGIGIAIGYGMGLKDGIEWSVKFASQFMTIEFDEDYIIEGIWRYQNHIGGCIDEGLPLRPV